MRNHPRRRVLQLLGGLAAGSVAGCSAVDDPDAPIAETTITDSPTPTETPTPEPTDTPTPEPIATEAWTTDSLEGEVRGLWLPNAPRASDSTGGPLYAGTTTGTVANIDVATGDVRWRFSVAGELALGGYPTVRNGGGALLVVSDTRNQETLRNYVEVVEPDSGARRWVFEEREFLRPLGVVDDTLYLAGEYIKLPPSELGPSQDPGGEGRLHALDLATGEERWRTVVPRLINASATDHGIYANVAENDDYTENSLVAFDHDGTERWRRWGARYFNPEPLPIEEGVLASAHGGSAALFAPDGTERWRVSGWRGGPSQLVATPEQIYVGSAPLVAVSRSGTERWRLDDYGGVIPHRGDSPQDTLYFEQGRRVGAIDPTVGTVRWSYDPENAKYIHARAVVDAGILVDHGINRGDEFILLDGATGDVAGEFTTPNPYDSTVAIGSRLFVGTKNAIYALDVEP